MVPRAAPLLVTLALRATGLVMVDAAVSAQDGVDLFDILRRPAALSAVIATGLVIVLAIPLGIAYAALQRRMTPTARLVVGQHGQLGRAARRPRTRRHRDEVRALVNDCGHRDCATTWGLTLAYDRPCGCPRVDVSAPGGGVHQAAGRVGSDLIGA